MNCVPLISDSPSFASQPIGSSPIRASASRAVEQLARRIHASPSPTSGSARCASGARSPRRRPSRGSARTARRPRFRHSSSSSTVSTRAPELPFASAFARSSIAARTTSSGYGSPTPHAWLRRRRSCSSLGLLLRDRLRDEPAEAGVDAVGVLARAVRGPLDRPRAPRASARAQRRRARPAPGRPRPPRRPRGRGRRPSARAPRSRPESRGAPVGSLRCPANPADRALGEVLRVLDVASPPTAGALSAAAPRRLRARLLPPTAVGERGSGDSLTTSR